MSRLYGRKHIAEPGTKILVRMKAFSPWYFGVLTPSCPRATLMMLSHDAQHYKSSVVISEGL